MGSYKLIANPAAGRGRARKAVLAVEEAFRRRGILFDLELTPGPGTAADIARRACSRFDVVVAVGGDGTVNEIATGMLHAKTPLGIVPAGSGNDFIKTLGIPNDIERAVDIVLRGQTRVIDAGRINDRYFVNGVGIGFDAAVNRASYGINHRKRGLWLYLCALAKTLGKYDPVPLMIGMNGATSNEKAFLLTVGNGTTCGGGFRLTPEAKIDDGLLDVTLVQPLSLLQLLWHFPKVFLGTIGRARQAELSRTEKLRVESEDGVPVHVDGEIYTGDTRRMEIEIIPGALTVIGNFA